MVLFNVSATMYIQTCIVYLAFAGAKSLTKTGQKQSWLRRVDSNGAYLAAKEGFTHTATSIDVYDTESAMLRTG